VPSRTFTATSNVSGAPEAIWERLQAPKTWENIAGVEEVSSPQFDGGELVGFTFHSSVGANRYKGTATRVSAEEPKKVRWSIATSEIRGWVEVELVDVRIQIGMNVESVSFMASIGFPLIASAIGGGFQQAVDDFAASLES
jgi:hypothetical protein